MSVHPELFSTADIRVSTPDDDDAHWAGTVEASGPQHVRVRLHPSRGQAPPRWGQGNPLYCAIGAGDDSYHAEGTLLKQEGSVVWIGVPAVWSQGERRLTARAAATFDVEINVAGKCSIARCVDLSAGGLRLETQETPPAGSSMKVSFTLPGDGPPIQTDGLVIRSYTEGAGVKFIRLQPSDGVRIAAFCHL